MSTPRILSRFSISRTLCYHSAIQSHTVCMYLQIIQAGTQLQDCGCSSGSKGCPSIFSRNLPGSQDQSGSWSGWPAVRKQSPTSIARTKSHITVCTVYSLRCLAYIHVYIYIIIYIIYIHTYSYVNIITYVCIYVCISANPYRQQGARQRRGTRGKLQESAGQEANCKNKRGKRQAASSRNQGTRNGESKKIASFL